MSQLPKIRLKIKSAITPWVWYAEHIGEIYEGKKHHTDSMFWFPGDVYDTVNGYVHANDAEVLEEINNNIHPIQNN